MGTTKQLRFDVSRLRFFFGSTISAAAKRSHALACPGSISVAYHANEQWEPAHVEYTHLHGVATYSCSDTLCSVEIV